MGKLDVRPLRTVLFCGGDRPDDIVRAFESGADSIVIDLEEPRTPFPESEREKARNVTRSFIDGAGPGPVAVQMQRFAAHLDSEASRLADA